MSFPRPLLGHHYLPVHSLGTPFKGLSNWSCHWKEDSPALESPSLGPVKRHAMVSPPPPEDAGGAKDDVFSHKCKETAFLKRAGWMNWEQKGLC